MGFGLTCEFNTCGQFVTVELDGLLMGLGSMDYVKAGRLAGILPNGTHFGCFAALSCLQHGPAKAGFRLKAGTTNFRTGVCSTEL